MTLQLTVVPLLSHNMHLWRTTLTQQRVQRCSTAVTQVWCQRGGWELCALGMDGVQTLLIWSALLVRCNIDSRVCSKTGNSCHLYLRSGIMRSVLSVCQSVQFYPVIYGCSDWCQLLVWLFSFLAMFCTQVSLKVILVWSKSHGHFFTQ